MAAPGLAVEDEVTALKAQRGPDLLDLVNEPRGIPQRLVVGLVAAAGAQLVVEVVLDARRREVAVDSLEIFVRRSWAPVQQQHLQVGVVADPLRPHPVQPRRRLDRIIRAPPLTTSSRPE
ncbi:MAG TPA: hypothetical protein VGJ59_24125 [Jatrophihabitantaceae bacterium]